MHRVEVQPSDTLATLLERLAPMMSAPAPDAIKLTRDIQGKDMVAEFESAISSLGFKHGDMLFASVAASARPSEEPASQEAQPLSGDRASASSAFFKQDEVDSQLEKDDGLIKRKRDVGFCKHGPNAMCEYCMPIEPFDPAYLAENKVKHLSFHAYLRKILSDQKIRGDISRGPSPNTPLPLEDPDYRVKPKCRSGHAPWPEGICTKCQPSAITLQRQQFRMVDNVEFAHRDIIDRLLSFWRTTRCQRFGFLYGRYERYNDVPLGIKAIVEAIYEPKQAWEEDGIKISLESKEFEDELKRADEVAEACGLAIVGMVFTDLESVEGNGKVLYRRHANSYFLTSLECRLAAYMELRHPNRCRWSSGGHFGSKFVTCCVSGNQDGDIDVTAWQLSNSAMAMQAADLIVPSSVPSKMCVREPTKTRYVPDIFYKYTNEYNLPVTANAKPAFPVEYLLVNLTSGYPKEPKPLFRSEDLFCIENREHLQQVQTPGLLKRRIESAKGSPERLSAVLSDFHLLVYLASLGVLSGDDMKLIGRIVSDPPAAAESAAQLEASGGWQTLALMLREASNDDLSQAAAGSAPGSGSAPVSSADGFGQSASSAGASSSSSSTWACRHCTFENSASNDSCEMCALPRD
ncbi:polyubiquitin-tagged protein recognition complex, Npl4 component [Martensiomyces pterosporus]|nr:polyubiquitin-tagged protein recognition complex, Npl4 component [Martensiomyces pterosporus]